MDKSAADSPLTRLPALSRARVLVIGDAMLDRYVYGRVERISPEAPIPVLLVERETAMLGGAGNVARNVAALGAASCLVTVAGNDRAGHEIAALMGAEKAIAAQLVVETGRHSSICRSRARAPTTIRHSGSTAPTRSRTATGRLAHSRP